MINGKNCWTFSSFVNILAAFKKDEDTQILFLDIKDGLTLEPYLLMKLFVTKVIDSPLTLDHLPDKHCLVITKPSYSGPIEPDSFSHIYKAGEEYPYVYRKPNDVLFRELVLAFNCNAIHTKLCVDISALPKNEAKEIIRDINKSLQHNLKIKFPSNVEAIIYKAGHKECPCYQPELHLYKLGEKYPYRPTSPKSDKEGEYYHSIAEVTKAINNANKTPDPLKNYHFIYKYSNTELHSDITPPWYKQAIDVCEDLRINLCSKLDNYIDSSDANIIVSYHNNQFIFDIYIEQIQEFLMKKIDNDLSVPCFTVHGWGGMNLTFVEVKEIK